MLTRVLIVLSIAFNVWKVHVFGVNIMGLSLMAQLALIYGLDRLLAHREWKNDPYHWWIDDNGVVQRELK